MSATRDARGRFVTSSAPQPNRTVILAPRPLSTLTTSQHATAVLVADFLAAVGRRLAQHMDAADQRARDRAAEHRRRFHAERRAARRDQLPIR